MASQDSSRWFGDTKKLASLYIILCQMLARSSYYIIKELTVRKIFALLEA